MAHTIFMTGATGNIGGRILKEALETTDATFKLLIFGKDDAGAKEELVRVLRFWDIDFNQEHISSRIEILRGDVSHPLLGFDAETHARVGASLTHAIHCAANLKLNLTLEEARTSILSGTQNVINICKHAVTKGTFRRFNHFSTMEVAGNMSGIIKEEFLTHTRRRFLNTYEQAKAETEEYLRELHEKEGFPITLYRPSMVVGDAENGKALNFQAFYHMIDDLFLAPQASIMPGHDDFIIDTVPISIIAKAVTLLHDSEESNGKIYHLSSGMHQTYPLSKFAELFGKTLTEITGTPFKQPRFVSPRLIWILNVISYPFTWGKLRQRLKVNFIFLKFFFLRVQFDNTNTKDFFERHGVTIPDLKEYLPHLIKYYLDHHVQTPLVK